MMHKTDAGAPLKGANSFTEGEAKDRAVAQGLMSVGALKKDDDGIWRVPNGEAIRWARQRAETSGCCAMSDARS